MEEQRILEMIEKGKITAAEGLELLEALKVTKAESTTQKIEGNPSKKEYQFLKVRVDAGDKTKVNVNIPLKLVKAVKGLIPQVNNMIPEEAKREMEKNGVNLGSLDLEAILGALELGDLEDQNFVDITAHDDKEGEVRVRVYVE